MNNKANNTNSSEDKWKKLDDVGSKIQSIGCLLTVLITIPIILIIGLTIWLGPLGLIIGIIISAIIALIGISAVIKKRKQASKK